MTFRPAPYTARATAGPSCRTGPSPRRGAGLSCKSGGTVFTSVVTAAQKPSYLSHRAAGPGFWAEYSYRLRYCEDKDAGFTTEDLGCAHLTIRAEYGGWLGRLVARLRPGACRRYLGDEMDAIVSISESVRAEPAGDE